MARGCPNCALSESYSRVFDGLKNNRGGYLEPSLENELRRFLSIKEPGWPFPRWPLASVKRIYNYIAGLLADSDEAINPQWDETTTQLARILLSERAQAKFRRDWKPEKS